MSKRIKHVEVYGAKKLGTPMRYGDFISVTYTRKQALKLVRKAKRANKHEK